MLYEVRERLLSSILIHSRSHYGPKLAAVSVFGSVGRNTMNQYSDIDVLIIADNLPPGRLSRMQDFENVEAKLRNDLTYAQDRGWHTEISPILKTPEEVGKGGLLYLDMIEDAVILYDREDFFARYLSSLSEKLRANHSRKNKWKGGWYWELKPDLVWGETIDL